MSGQTIAGPQDTYYIKSRGTDAVAFNKQTTPPLSYLDKGSLYELDDGLLYFDGTPLTGASASVATSLATTGAPVNVSLAAPPTSGQVLTSTSPTTSSWQTPSTVFRDNVTFIVDNAFVDRRLGFNVIGSAATTTTLVANQTANRAVTLPDATDTLVGRATTDTLTNKNISGATNTVEASALRTTTAPVVVSAAVAPIAGLGLVATSATTAAWSTVVAGPPASVNLTVPKWNGTTGRSLVNTGVSISALDALSIPGNLLLPATTSASVGNVLVGGTRFISGFGAANTFVGANSGNITLSGANNTGIGPQVLSAITSGASNTCVGSDCGVSVTTGTNNACMGHNSGLRLTTGSNNTFIGESSGRELLTGSSNVIVGGITAAYTTSETNNIVIGGTGVIADNNTIRIGLGTHVRNFTNGIRGRTTGVADAIPVLVDSAGQLGTVSSSIKYKENIHDLVSMESIIRQLRPVEFNYKGQDSKSIGLIAEEVEAIYPEMCIYTDASKTELLTVDYPRLTVMLLKCVQELLARHPVSQ